MKQIISSYFNFTKKERIGIVSLIVIILLLSISPFFFHVFSKNISISNSNELENAIASLEIKAAENNSNNYDKRNVDESNYQNYYQPSEKKYSNYQSIDLFYFDPNIASEDDWKKLGVKEKTIQTIIKFRSKGGKFYKPEDIEKIWGLHPKLVERLIPYVRIVGKEEFVKAPKSFENKKETQLIPIDINTADTTQLIRLPGIGSKLSQRIINYRDKLGGFHSVDQVGQTYGLPDSTFQKIKPRLKVSSDFIKKININSATLDELKAHPYIRYNLANALVQYRIQHGAYTTIDDCKKIMLVTEEVFTKISPYIRVK